MTTPDRAKASRSPGPDMQDVARLAGVSPQTVSRTLRGYPHVSASAREKVLAAVRELGYRRNTAAAALASGRSRSIGVVALGQGSFRFEVMTGISAVAEQARYTLNMVTAASEAPEHIAAAVSRLLDQSVAGVVLALTLDETSPELEAVLAEVPSIAVDGHRPEWADAIAVDSETATRNAVRYLLDLGHSTVHYMSGSGGARLTEAWRSSLEESGKEIPPVLAGDWTPESGYALAERLLDSRATAVLVAGDEMAFGVLRRLSVAGVSVPDAMSVMGAAASRFSEWMSPPLSSIDEPLAERGARAARYLLRRIGEADEPLAEQVIVPELLLRSTTAPPPRGAR
ncbi:LacI family DNA-binding transcriptional regulator [Microbacterium hydrocarbonoxydans]|uniref:LacI family DNA-binding transcriptional regulator n=1 Tax=Microbacterium hydrocarbonoxydans TaxID=273678 RepID=UPI00203AB21B|nr:LacI family DNA-binding transcriptional regulator [Microbacterium hydrocarbonoxydans]MCM3778248.1 LacI family transcriptional regulator [Microbacterium hydrocarbonoxydans]